MLSTSGNYLFVNNYLGAGAIYQKSRDSMTRLRCSCTFRYFLHRAFRCIHMYKRVGLQMHSLRLKYTLTLLDWPNTTQKINEYN